MHRRGSDPLLPEVKDSMRTGRANFVPAIRREETEPLPAQSSALRNYMGFSTPSNVLSKSKSCATEPIPIVVPCTASR